jgi:hypothetical protein
MMICSDLPRRDDTAPTTIAALFQREEKGQLRLLGHTEVQFDSFNPNYAQQLYFANPRTNPLEVVQPTKLILRYACALCTFLCSND